VAAPLNGALAPSPQRDPAPHLELRGVRKRFGASLALDGIDLKVYEGEVIVVLGRSGSGKSTLVRCIHQLTPIDGGAIYLDGELLGYERVRSGIRPLSARAVAQQRAQIGMVFQHFNLFPHLSVIDNVTLAPIRARRIPRAQAMETGLALVEQVGLSHKADAYPRELSGGQQQRVAIARMLAMEPRLLLFDEPTSALDPELVGEVLNVMRSLAERRNTMLIVTHEIEFARDVASRVIFLDGGRIAADGSVKEVIDNPASDSLRSFLARVPGARHAHSE
jgi:ABC-type polar amino acid transport system ATPase subunit